MVPNVGFELTTYCLQDSCSTTELIRQKKEGGETIHPNKKSQVFIL